MKQKEEKIETCAADKAKEIEEASSTKVPSKLARGLLKIYVLHHFDCLSKRFVA